MQEPFDRVANECARLRERHESGRVPAALVVPADFLGDAQEELAGQVGGDLEVVVPTDLDSVRETIAGARLLIGSRMHACLNALSVGTPAIPLAYSRKFAPLLDSVGWTTGFDLRTDDPATLPPQIVAAAWKVTAGQARAASAAGRQSLDALQARVQGLLPLAVPAPLRSGM